MTTEPQLANIIKFEDIRKGDHIKVTYPYPNTKTVETIEGTAATKRDYRNDTSVWFTEGPYEKTLAYSQSKENHIIELLDRPVRKLPQAIGSVIIAKKLNGVPGNYTLFRATPTDEWDMSPWIVSADAEGLYRWIADEEIEDWTEMVITEKEDN